MSESQIDGYLLNVKAKYKDIAKRDIIQALRSYTELIPGVENYVFANGQSKDLFTLNGTIPVTYKSKRYNIPVQFYFLDTYPYNSPICYVRPTQDMTVNVNETVDSNGRINLAYLLEWKFPNSDLKSLIDTIVSKFMEVTPLFARPSVSNTTNIQYPTTIASKSTSNLTPYPQTSSTNSALPYPVTNTFPNPQPYTSIPPYPTATPQQANSLTQNYAYPSYNYQNPQQSFNYPNYPYSNNNYLYKPGFTASNIQNTSNQSTSKQLPQPPLPPYPTNTIPQRAQNINFDGDSTIKPEHFKMSLISAVEDKIRKRVYDYRNQIAGELESLRKTNNDLEIGEKRINDIIQSAEYEVESIKRYSSELKIKISEINKDIGRIKYRDQSNIDDAVVAIAPLYRQIMQLFAEELALQDLIFYLNEGLLNKTVNLDLFLKQIRFLSRKQFMVRALIQKCREHAGLRT